MRILYLDFIRAIAVVLIVLIHITAPTLLVDDNILVSGWEANLIMNALARPGVPLFFMLSGALFLNPRKEVSSSYIKKKIVRIVAAFVVFSLLYNLIWFLGRYQLNFTLGDVVYKFIPGFINGWFHLWYLQALFVLYLLTPIFRKIVDDIKVCWYFIFILFNACSLLPFIGHFFDYEPYIGKLIANMAFNLPQYALFFVLGYAISQQQCHFKPIQLCLGGAFL